MSSPCRDTKRSAPSPRTVLLLAIALTAPGCRREIREFPTTASNETEQRVVVSALRPGASRPPESRSSTGIETRDGATLSAAADVPYEANAYAVNEGKRLYSAYNCVGCHAHGGGGMGPALMDDEWSYGFEPAQVYRSILEGRPNGMPAWRGKIPDDQIWQLAAYVRSMSGQVPKDSAPSRDDHMATRPPENATPKASPKDSAVAPASVQ